MDGTVNGSGTTSITFYLMLAYTLFDKSSMLKILLHQQNYFHTFPTDLNVLLKGIPLD